MKYYIIAGEASGDLHGSNLIAALHQRDQQADIRCWGGDKMEAAGATVVKHYRELAFMGFTEVLMNLRTILRNLSFCKKDIADWKPDVLILIDYPGFNLRIAQWAKAQGMKVVYYISPQVWAWKEKRVKMMKECIDLMMVILPFEKDWYQRRWSWDVHYVGHPLVSVTERFKPRINRFSDKPVVAILPGSRKQEINIKLPIMLKMAARFPQYQFIVAMAPGLEESYYLPFLKPYPNVSSVAGLTYDLLLQSRAAIVTSGTATLETALFGVPQVVCYKGNPISFQIAKWVVDIKYISLVNLIMDAHVVKELIQHDMTEENIARELDRLLHDEVRIASVKSHYAALKAMLVEGGDASSKAAQLVTDFLQAK